MKPIHLLFCVALAALSTGCFRTVYHNLEPPTPPVADYPSYGASASSWRHFFLYGWVPTELVIDAAAQCGGTERVREIRTRQTFVQGLIAAFAGYYVNIYSPYTGHVVCEGERES